jgi:high-affinity iron transporter
MTRHARLLAVLVLAAGAASAAPPEVLRSADRFLWLLRGVEGEYAEAFDPDGRLARPIEIDEANLLLAEARDLAPAIGIPVGDVARLERAIAERASEGVVQDLVRGLGDRVTAATGVVAQVLPPEPPSAARGAALYAENCATCHGADGSGNGDESRRLDLKPANFRDLAFMRAETPDDFFNVITLGRRRSGMPAWGEALSVQARWDLVRHVWTFAAPEGEAATVPAGLAVPLPTEIVRQSDEDLHRLVPVADGTTDGARWAIVAALRSRGFDGLVGTGAARTPPTPARDPRESLAEVRGLLDAVLAAHRGGDRTAVGIATDAYMRFEPVERRLGAVAPGMVGRVEEGFVRLRHALRDPAAGDPAILIATLHRDLDEAAIALEPGAGAWVRFVQSAGIILREGFEVVLIVGALLTYVRRRGDGVMVRSLHAGTVAGFAASAVTAVMLVRILRMTPWAAEALEGAAMLLAAVVLFWVSYWLVSKAEADRWQRYIRGKVEGALTRRNGIALAAAAFLAVYREGFETILFYQALFATAPTGDVMIPAGIVAGLGALAILYVALKRIGLRVPMGTFFLVTGGFLYAMAIVFAGGGVAELQEAGLVSTTPVSRVPLVEPLGLYPTVETLAAQGVFVLLLVYAVGVTLRQRARRAAAGDEPARAGGAGEGEREAAGESL